VKNTTDQMVLISTNIQENFLNLIFKQNLGINQQNLKNDEYYIFESGKYYILDNGEYYLNDEKKEIKKKEIIKKDFDLNKINFEQTFLGIGKKKKKKYFLKFLEKEDDKDDKDDDDEEDEKEKKKKNFEKKENEKVGEKKKEKEEKNIEKSFFVPSSMNFVVFSEAGLKSFFGEMNYNILLEQKKLGVTEVVDFLNNRYYIFNTKRKCNFFFFYLI